ERFAADVARHMLLIRRDKHDIARSNTNVATFRNGEPRPAQYVNASSKPSCRCGPRGLSPGFAGGISTMRSVMRDPVSPEMGSSDTRPGSSRRLASDDLNKRAIIRPVATV